MDVITFRHELGLSQGEFAARVGLRSKGHVSALERGGKVGVRVALEIERLSGGAIPASSVNDDVKLIEAFRGQAV